MNTAKVTDIPLRMIKINIKGVEPKIHLRIFEEENVSKALDQLFIDYEAEIKAKICEYLDFLSMQCEPPFDQIIYCFKIYYCKDILCRAVRCNGIYNGNSEEGVLQFINKNTLYAAIKGMVMYEAFRKIYAEYTNIIS